MRSLLLFVIVISVAFGGIAFATEFTRDYCADNTANLDACQDCVHYVDLVDPSVPQSLLMQMDLECQAEHCFFAEIDNQPVYCCEKATGTVCHEY